MKVCTITCHDVYNAGASLQAYALISYLHDCGCEANVIDYKPDYLAGHYSMTAIANPKFNRPVIREMYLAAKFPERLARRLSRRKKRFDAFTREYLPLTERYVSFDELTADPPEADVFLAGSDQIWNTAFKNGHDPAFYLAFAPAGAVRASYAASFAADAADPACAVQQKAWISALDAVSVREKTGLDILTQLGVESGVTVADPVFLPGADVWRRIETPAKPPKKPYVLVYDFDGSSEIRQAAETLKRKTGYDVYTLQKLPYGDKCVADSGPREFVTLIDNAAFVLSNSFHATAFSLILHTPFMVYDRKEKLNSLMRDLMALAGLAARTGADEPVDWQDVDARMTAAVQASRQYLTDVMAMADERAGQGKA